MGNKWARMAAEVGNHIPNLKIFLINVWSLQFLKKLCHVNGIGMSNFVHGT
jgi:hypothetical protein